MRRKSKHALTLQKQPKSSFYKNEFPGKILTCKCTFEGNQTCHKLSLLSKSTFSIQKYFLNQNIPLDLVRVWFHLELTIETLVNVILCNLLFLSLIFSCNVFTVEFRGLIFFHIF